MSEAIVEEPTPPGVPARQVILSAVALWLCYYLLITVRGLVVELGEFNELLWRRGLVTAAGIVITLMTWPLLRRFDGRSLMVRAIAALVIMFPAALAIAFVNQLTFAPVEKRMLARIAEEQAANVKQGKTSQIQIRHDMAGNVLVDVLDDKLVPPPAPVPPQPTASPVTAPVPPSGVTTPPAVPDPGMVLDQRDIEELEKLSQLGGLDEDEDVSISHGEDGSVLITRPGVVIRRFADGSSEVVAGGFVIRRDAEGSVSTITRTEPSGEPGSVPPAPPGTVAPPAPPAAAVRSTAQSPALPRPAPAINPKQVTRADPVAGAAPADAATELATEEFRGPDRVTIIQKSVEDEGLWRQLTDVALGRYFLLLAWAALYLALGNAAQVQAAERREGEFKRAAKAAELRSLRYQVNPHFLFNTLNSLSALVMSGRSETAERMIQTMSNFYRHSLASDPTADMPLADEIELQRHYLEIEGVRFPERLRAEFDVPAALSSACVPGMILQPLVENSVKYAVSATSRPVTIRISAREAGDKLVLTVSDDGPGKPEGPGGTGIGLANVRDRLAARFGGEASVESGPLPAGGYSTTLILPVVRNDC